MAKDSARAAADTKLVFFISGPRSEEHTSELQSRPHLVCRLLLEKKKILTARHAPVLDAAHIVPNMRVGRDEREDLELRARADRVGALRFGIPDIEHRVRHRRDVD